MFCHDIINLISYDAEDTAELREESILLVELFG